MDKVDGPDADKFEWIKLEILIKYLNSFILYVKQGCNMIQTCYFGPGKYGTYFPLMNKY
jgi:hypothetical protein